MAAITDIFVDQGTDFTLQLSVVDTAGTAKNLRSNHYSSS